MSHQNTIISHRQGFTFPPILRSLSHNQIASEERYENKYLRKQLLCDCFSNRFGPQCCVVSELTSDCMLWPMSINPEIYDARALKHWKSSSQTASPHSFPAASTQTLSIQSATTGKSWTLITSWLLSHNPWFSHLTLQYKHIIQSQSWLSWSIRFLYTRFLVVISKQGSSKIWGVYICFLSDRHPVAWTRARYRHRGWLLFSQFMKLLRGGDLDLSSLSLNHRLHVYVTWGTFLVPTVLVMELRLESPCKVVNVCMKVVSRERGREFERWWMGTRAWGAVDWLRLAILMRMEVSWERKGKAWEGCLLTLFMSRFCGVKGEIIFWC